MQTKSIALSRAGQKIGLIPTMGALHEGHLSLVRAAMKECDVTVVTIFVNRTQFAPGEDLDKYPRTLTEDLEKLGAIGTDFVFAPDDESMYPEGYSTYIDGPATTQALEGELRPTHFRGVTTVVAKLFNIVRADHAYFGQKDYQQALVLYRMVCDLNFPINVRVCPIVREQDGLAMSSRNRYLSEDERQRALSLWKSLNLGRKLIRAGERDAATLIQHMREALEEGGVSKIDYVQIVDPETLETTDFSKLNRGSDKVAILVAASVGATRLIDNLVVDVNSDETAELSVETNDETNDDANDDANEDS